MSKVHGEIISWTCSNVKVPHKVLVKALEDAGLDSSAARSILPRHAFSRACKKMAQSRIIRQVEDKGDLLTFQFTRESLKGDRFEYALETLVTLDKTTGRVSCPEPELLLLAQGLLDEAIENRTGNDVTRIVQRLFKQSADLFPVRDRGGVYFCLAMHRPFLERIDKFLECVKHKLARFPVVAGEAAGDRSVKESVVAGVEAMLEEHEKAMDAFTDKTRPDTYDRREQAIRATQFKLEAYAEYLGEQKERLEKALQGMQARLLAIMVGDIPQGRPQGPHAPEEPVSAPSANGLMQEWVGQEEQDTLGDDSEDRYEVPEDEPEDFQSDDALVEEAASSGGVGGGSKSDPFAWAD